MRRGHRRTPHAVHPVTRNGPELWGQLLDAVNVKGAVVAGGCIRDFLLEVPPKDYDIFIPGDLHELEGVVGEMNALGTADLTILGWNGDYESYDDPLKAVCEGEILGLPANIICNERMYQGPEYLVEGFDFAIAQGWWCQGMLEPQLTEAAQKDIRDRTATLVTYRTYDRSRRRFDRYNARNGAILKLVDPRQPEFSF